MPSQDSHRAVPPINEFLLPELLTFQPLVELREEEMSRPPIRRRCGWVQRAGPVTSAVEGGTNQGLCPEFPPHCRKCDCTVFGEDEGECTEPVSAVQVNLSVPRFAASLSVPFRRYRSATCTT